MNEKEKTRTAYGVSGIFQELYLSMRKRYFRFHRGGFIDSMDTKQEVTSASDIKNILNNDFPDGYLSNIRIDESVIKDPRTLNSDWGDDTYMVVADFEGYTGQCLGYANFFEK